MDMLIAVDAPNDKVTHIRVQVDDGLRGGSFLSVGPWYERANRGKPLGPHAIRTVRRSIVRPDTSKEDLEFSVKQAISSKFKNSRVWSMIEWACDTVGASISSAEISQAVERSR